MVSKFSGLASDTASEILTKVKTVDGASSLLDADLLDGQHGSYYAPKATTLAGYGITDAQLDLNRTNFTYSRGITTTTGWTKLGTYFGNRMDRFEITILGKAGYNDQNFCSKATLHGGTNYIVTDTGQ